jgi:hypothetical protein
MFVLGEIYTRDQIHEELGGSKQSYLPNVNGRVVAGCFTKEANPDAPDEILPGKGEEVERSAEMFARQGDAVPVFMKESVNQWKYVGDYVVEYISFDRDKLAEKEKVVGRPVTSVLRLRRVNTV